MTGDGRHKTPARVQVFHFEKKVDPPAPRPGVIPPVTHSPGRSTTGASTSARPSGESPAAAARNSPPGRPARDAASLPAEGKPHRGESAGRSGAPPAIEFGGSSARRSVAREAAAPALGPRTGANRGPAARTSAIETPAAPASEHADSTAHRTPVDFAAVPTRRRDPGHEARATPVERRAAPVSERRAERPAHRTPVEFPAVSMPRQGAGRDRMTPVEMRAAATPRDESGEPRTTPVDLPAVSVPRESDREPRTTPVDMPAISVPQDADPEPRTTPVDVPAIPATQDADRERRTTPVDVPAIPAAQDADREPRTTSVDMPAVPAAQNPGLEPRATPVGVRAATEDDDTRRRARRHPAAAHLSPSPRRGSSEAIARASEGEASRPRRGARPFEAGRGPKFEARTVPIEPRAAASDRQPATELERHNTPVDSPAASGWRREGEHQARFDARNSGASTLSTAGARTTPAGSTKVTDASRENAAPPRSTPPEALSTRPEGRPEPEAEVDHRAARQAPVHEPLGESPPGPETDSATSPEVRAASARLQSGGDEEALGHHLLKLQSLTRREDTESLADLAVFGHALFARGRLREAQVVFEGIVARAPGESFAFAMLGAICLSQGDEDRALALFDTALELDPAEIAALVSRGEIHLRRGLLTLALRDLEGAIAADPAGKDPYCERAHALMILARTLLRAER